MLKSLRIKNFEAHEDSFIQFAPGFNLIRGASDVGKSSIFRAIRMIAYNKWDKAGIRLGAKKTIVSLETNRGKVELERSVSKNTWEVSDNNGGEQRFESIGKGVVPTQISDIIGLKRVDFGGVEMELNLLSQLDKHFLMAEVDGKKITASGAAQIIDEICGLEGIEGLVDDIALDINRATKEANRLEAEVIDLEEQLEDPEELEKERETVEELKALIKTHEDLSAQHQKVTKLSEGVNIVNSDVSEIKDKLKVIPDFETAVRLLKDSEIGFISSDKMVSVVNAVKTKEEEKINNQNDLKKIPDVDGIGRLLDESENNNKRNSKMVLFIDNVKRKQSEITNDKNKLAKIPDLGGIDKNVNEAEGLLKQYERADVLTKDRNKSLGYQDVEMMNLKDMNSKIDSTEEELEKLMDEVTVCPLTGESIIEGCKLIRKSVVKK